jgi:hypothetical protein
MKFQGWTMVQRVRAFSGNTRGHQSKEYDGGPHRSWMAQTRCEG